MENKEKKLILIDANALMHRAYHALPPLTTKNGEVVNAVYGFTSVLLKVIKDLKPDYIGCAFDVAGGTFRDEIYKDYKAGRKKPDQEFYDQIPKIKEIVKALNIPIVEKKGFEADDVIGSLCEKAGHNLKKIIVTGDLDTLQLIDEKTQVYTLRKGIKDTVLYDKKAVIGKYGLTPEQIIDFKGLRGDPSDNIPGVKGIGEKGAIDLLKNFGSIEKLYKAIEQKKDKGKIKEKVKEKLVEQKKEAMMSKKLATINRDMKIEFDLKKYAWGDYDKEELNKIFRKLEFYSLIERVESANNKGFVEEKYNSPIAGKKFLKCIIIDDEKKLENFLSLVSKQKEIVFQTKGNEDNPDNRDLSGLVFLWRGSPVYYVPLNLKGDKLNLFNSSDQTAGFSLERVKPVLENEEIKKIGYFLKKDIKLLFAHEIDMKGIDFDAMLAAYLLDPGKRNYSEEKIIFDYLGFAGREKMKNEEEMKEKIKSVSDMAKLSHFFELREKMDKKIKESGMKNLFYNIEMPLIKSLVKMEENGVKLDVDLLKIISSEMEIKISKLAEKIHKLSGDEIFNINSSQQLSHILFEKMKLPVADIKRTQTGYSVAATEMEKLKEEHIIISFILEYKELVKLKNTYVDALPKLVDKRTKRLHTTFHQTVTSTGRLSSSDPNLQNIPIRTEIGRKIRKAFVAEPGRKMISADYSQIELRIIAMIADDGKMKKIFSDGLDIHSATAAEINQVPIGEVTPEMRRAAKALNFGVIYGMSVFGFAQSAGIERNRAKEFIDNYMEKFSNIAKYIEKTKADAREKGYAQTIWGRRRYLPELKSSNAVVKNSAERMAINMPIQGTAADIIKITMLKVDEWIAEYNEKNDDAVRMLLQVHDELLFSVKESSIKDAVVGIKGIMENSHLQADGKIVDFPVPIVVDIKTGDNWEEMEDYQI